MRNLGSINESEDIVTKDYADQKLPGRPITKYDYDHLSPAEKDADIVYFIIDDDQDTLEFDEVPTAGSDNPVKSKGIKSALDAKQNTLTFDQTPTAESQNPVTSGGVKSAMDALQTKLEPLIIALPAGGSVRILRPTVANAFFSLLAYTMGAYSDSNYGMYMVTGYSDIAGSATVADIKAAANISYTVSASAIKFTNNSQYSNWLAVNVLYDPKAGVRLEAVE